MPSVTPCNLRRHERATLGYSYVGEMGRGMFEGLTGDFAMLVAVSHFAVLNRGLLWLLSAAPFIGYTASLLAAPLSNTWRKKSMVRILEASACLLLMGAALAWSGPTFVIFMACGVAVVRFATPLISGIYGSNFRTEVRGPAVSRLQMLRLATVAATGAVAGALMDKSTAWYRPTLFLLSVVMIACAWIVWRLPESRPKSGVAGPNGLSACIRILLTDRAFLLLEAAWFLLGISNLQMMPLKVLYLRDLGFGEWQIMLCTTTTMFSAMVVSTALWGLILYRINFAIYRILTNLFIMLGLYLFFRGTTPVTVAIGSALWAAGLAGGGLCWRLVATFFTTPKQGPAYMSIHTFLCGIRGMLAPLLGLQAYGHIPMQTLTIVSLLGLGISTLMFLPLIPALARRNRTAA